MSLQSLYPECLWEAPLICIYRAEAVQLHDPKTLHTCVPSWEQAYNEMHTFSRWLQIWTFQDVPGLGSHDAFSLFTNVQTAAKREH